MVQVKTRDRQPPPVPDLGVERYVSPVIGNEVLVHLEVHLAAFQIVLAEPSFEGLPPQRRPPSFVGQPLRRADGVRRRHSEPQGPALGEVEGASGKLIEVHHRPAEKGGWICQRPLLVPLQPKAAPAR